LISEKNNLPVVVISLDFEMRWGMHDKLGLQKDAYRENIENERLIVVPELLKLFKDRNVRVTWATVGALGCHNWDEYFSRAPQPPKYHNTSFAINPRYADFDPDGELFFAPELLKAISETPGQELGTHTFSHIFLREPGITDKDFEADLEAVSKLWVEHFGASPKSLVFPRNQCAFIDVLRTSSIRIWRGNEIPWYYNCNETATNLKFPRLLRLVDALNPFVRRASILSGDMTRSSLFLRINLSDFAWRLHFERIKSELKSLQSGDIFHIWWHPHNLGKETSLRLSRIEQLLDAIAGKNEHGQLTSQNMGDLIS